MECTSTLLDVLDGGGAQNMNTNLDNDSLDNLSMASSLQMELSPELKDLEGHHPQLGNEAAANTVSSQHFFTAVATSMSSASAGGVVASSAVTSGESGQLSYSVLGGETIDKGETDGHTHTRIVDRLVLKKLARNVRTPSLRSIIILIELNSLFGLHFILFFYV